MRCDKCGAGMFIDEWNGWVWYCPFCDIIGRKAEDEEIAEQQKELYGESPAKSEAIDDK